MDQKNAVLQAKQGFRRRHPHEVLGRYAALMTTTDSTSTVVEAAMEFEHMKTEIPKEMQPTDIAQGLTTQYHVSDVAGANYRNSKQKLRNMHLVGV